MTFPAASRYFLSAKHQRDAVFFVHMSRVIVSYIRAVHQFEIIQMRHSPEFNLPGIVLNFHILDW